MDTLNVLHTLHSYYNEAFNQLITITLGILGFAGIIMPLLLQWLQSRTFTYERSRIHQDLANLVATATQSLDNKLTAMLDSKMSPIKLEMQQGIADLREQMKANLAESIAKAHHIQATSLLEKNNFSGAAVDYAIAGFSYLDGNDELNVRRCVNSLTQLALPKLSKKAVADNDDIEKQIQQFTEGLQKKNVNGRYQDGIAEIKRQLKAAKDREKKTA